MTRIRADDAARQLSDLLDRTLDRGETFEVERGDQVVALLIAPPSRRATRLHDLLPVFANTSGDPTFADDLERAQAELNFPDSNSR